MKRNYFLNANTAANETYSNYGGNGWNNMADSYDYFDDYNYAEGDAGVTEANAKASLPFNINIQNTTSTDVQNVIILNANATTAAGVTNFGNVADIIITMDNGAITYGQFLESIKSEPFKVGLIYLQSSNANQPYKSLTIGYTEANGRTVTLPVTPRVDPMQNQSGVTIVRYQFPINSWTSITTTILGSATLSLAIYPSTQLDTARALSGRSVAKDYTKPNLSQFQAPNGRGLVG